MIYGKKAVFLVTAAALALASVQAEARPWTSSRSITCVTTGVLNGNLFQCVDSNKKTYLVKMADIEAPELGQPYGPEAKNYLKSTIYNQRITVKIRGNADKETVRGELYFGKKNLNREMIRRGLAWSDRSNGDSMYRSLENDAHSDGTGLWSDVAAEYPADFRKKHPNDIDELIRMEQEENSRQKE